MKPGDNLLIAGDNLTAAPLLLSSFAGQVDLIYLDPPFATGRAFPLRPPPGGGDSVFPRELAYEDRWQGDPERFLNFLEPRLILCRDLLSSRGTLYLHLDFRRVHHARLLLDRVFGERCFRNEIIWHYRSGGRPQGAFAFKHDTILVYGKNPEGYFDGDAVAIPRVTARSNKMKRAVDEHGRTYRSIRSAGKEYRYYDDERVIPDDVWSDIGHLHQRDPERTGYPTQKPEKLLERILLASSPPGGRVADLFCGSGTTLAVAQRLGRCWIGCDESPAAIQITCRRLAKAPFVLHRKLPSATSLATEEPATGPAQENTLETKQVAPDPNLRGHRASARCAGVDLEGHRDGNLAPHRCASHRAGQVPQRTSDSCGHRLA
ncbi:MAG: site-specific DNA-methyltransferase [Myxococcales bacterium]|nr:site-specific DNA-methyltransferase [Polyangiaceae bacterium]MDW8247802.1 site-specific DNA-methyltransferase [Myxococcales bacterium]